MAPTGPTSVAAAALAVTFSGLWGGFGPALNGLVPMDASAPQEEPSASEVEEGDLGAKSDTAAPQSQEFAASECVESSTAELESEAPDSADRVAKKADGNDEIAKKADGNDELAKKADSNATIADTPPLACNLMIFGAVVDGLLLLGGALWRRRAARQQPVLAKNEGTDESALDEKESLPAAKTELATPSSVENVQAAEESLPAAKTELTTSSSVENVQAVEDMQPASAEIQELAPADRLVLPDIAESPAKPANLEAADLAMSPGDGLAMTPQRLAMTPQRIDELTARNRRRSVTFKLPESPLNEEYEKDHKTAGSAANDGCEDSLGTSPKVQARHESSLDAMLADMQWLWNGEKKPVFAEQPKSSSLGTVLEDGGTVEAPRQPPPASSEPKRLNMPKRLPRRRLKLQSAEQQLLKLGLQFLHSQLKEAGANMTELMALPGGKCKILQKSFFTKLLSGELQLRSMMANDVSSAQMDLRHLALESLLTLRVQSLDFATDSRSHEAHGNFLTALDRQLFEQLAQRICKSSMKEESSPPSKEVLRHIGLRSTLVVGAAESLSRPKKVQNDAKAEHVSLEDTDEEELLQELQKLMEEINEEKRVQDEHHDASWRRFCRRCYWTIPLGPNDWPGHSLVLLRPASEAPSGLPEAKGLGESSQEIALASAGGPVAVIWDQSTSCRGPRSLHWEVKLIDPSSEDVLNEISRTQDTGAQRAKLAQELSTALKSRGVAEAKAVQLRREDAPERTEQNGEIDEAAYRAVKSALKVIAASGLTLDEVSEAQPEAYAAVQSAAQHAKRCGLQFEEVFRTAQTFHETVLGSPESSDKMEKSSVESSVPTPSRGVGTARRARNRAMM